MDRIEIYYYKLNKTTGKVKKTILSAKRKHNNYNPDIIEYRFRHPCGNSAKISKDDFDKVSDAGIWLVSFKNDTESATSLFKEWWKIKTIEATERYENAMIHYSKCRTLYESIS